MNSQKNNNRNSTLSRDEINRYRETNDESVKFSIEKKSMEDDFDMEALEGWSTAHAGTNSMSQLDNKFRQKNYSQIITFSILFLTLISLTIYLFTSSKDITEKNKPNILSKPKVTIEKTDVLISSEISNMNELPHKEQIKIKTIQKDLVSQKRDVNFTHEKNEPKLKIEPLPLVSIKKIETTINANRNQESGKEIYLHDVKLIDYRAYRSKPQIKAKQLILNGTPASQENQSFNVNNLNEWKTIDIPYIEYIDKTISIFAKGNNKKALARLEQILETYPEDLNANFYSGICYFNLNEFNKAISAFEKCLNSQFMNFNDEAEWYLAKSLKANHEEEKADKLFEKIKNSNSYYSNQLK
jgi:TolA-binding protein